MKHIDIKIKCVRNVVKESNIKIEYSPTNMQIADEFKRALHKAKFHKMLFFCCLYKQCFPLYHIIFNVCLLEFFIQFL